jgi:hypothetical protein
MSKFFYLSLPAASVYFNYTEKAKCLNITDQGETFVCRSFIRYYYAYCYQDVNITKIKIIHVESPEAFLTFSCLKT